MAARAITRRSMLAVSAGALAGAVGHPAELLAALAATAQPRLQGRWLGTLPAGGRHVELARNADLVGLRWQAPADVNLELRFRDARGRWSGWARAGPGGHGPDRPPPAGEPAGDPVWTGGTRELQLR